MGMESFGVVNPVEEKPEVVPSSKHEKTEEEINVSRREYAREFEAHANARNEHHRGFLKKIFGAGKESDTDLAQEEALRINKLTDQKIEREGAGTSAQAASEEISQGHQFTEKEGYVGRDVEESIKAKYSDAVKSAQESLQSGDIVSARKVFDGIINDLPNGSSEKYSYLQRVREKMIRDEVEGLVRSGNLKAVERLIVVDEKAYDLDPDINEYVRSGVITPESAQKIIQSEVVQNKIIDHIKKTKYFSDAAKFFVNRKLMTQERADQFISDLEAKSAIDAAAK